MNDNEKPALRMEDLRVLEAMKAVNPRLESLMTERGQLRRNMREQETKLEFAETRLKSLAQFSSVTIPDQVARHRSKILIVLAGLVTLHAIALFSGLIDPKYTWLLFPPFLFAFWQIEGLQKQIGQWLGANGPDRAGSRNEKCELPTEQR
jgi:hypothetical protein